MYNQNLILKYIKYHDKLTMMYSGCSGTYYFVSADNGSISVTAPIKEGAIPNDKFSFNIAYASINQIKELDDRMSPEEKRDSQSNQSKNNDDSFTYSGIFPSFAITPATSDNSALSACVPAQPLFFLSMQNIPEDIGLVLFQDVDDMNTDAALSPEIDKQTLALCYPSNNLASGNWNYAWINASESPPTILSQQSFLVGETWAYCHESIAGPIQELRVTTREEACRTLISYKPYVWKQVPQSFASSDASQLAYDPSANAFSINTAAPNQSTGYRIGSYQPTREQAIFIANIYKAGRPPNLWEASQVAAMMSSSEKTEYPAANVTYFVSDLLRDPVGSLASTGVKMDSGTPQQIALARNIGSIFSTLIQAVLPARVGQAMQVTGAAIKLITDAAVGKKEIDLGTFENFTFSMKDFLTPKVSAKPTQEEMASVKLDMEKINAASSPVPKEKIDAFWRDVRSIKEHRSPIVTTNEIKKLWPDSDRYVVAPNNMEMLSGSDRGIYTGASGKQYIKVDGVVCRISGTDAKGMPILGGISGNPIVGNAPGLIRSVEGDFTLARLKGGGKFSGEYMGTTTDADGNWLPVRGFEEGATTVDRRGDLRNHIEGGYSYDFNLKYRTTKATPTASRNISAKEFASKNVVENVSVTNLPGGANSNINNAYRTSGEYSFALSTHTISVSGESSPVAINWVELLEPNTPPRAGINPVEAYWAAQGGSVDIPIHPGAGEPKLLFTPNLTGCHLVVDRLNPTTYRVYHIQNAHVDAEYNLQTDHGDGQVGAVFSNDYLEITGSGTDTRGGITTPVTHYTEAGFAYMSYDDTSRIWQIKLIPQTPPPALSRVGIDAPTFSIDGQKPRTFGQIGRFIIPPAG